MKILLVEDLRDLREVLERVLAASGHQVTALGDAEAALAAAKDPALAVDLLLTDSKLPGLDGAELAKRLRQRWPRLKVLLVSGETQASQDLDWLRGWGEYLAKPFDFDVMLAALERLRAQP